MYVFMCVSDCVMVFEYLTKMAKSQQQKIKIDNNK